MMTKSITTLAFQEELIVAKRAVRMACRLCQHVRRQSFRDATTTTKADQSPVTVADYGSQAVICAQLQQSVSFATDAVVAEEEASELRDNPAMLDQVVAYVQKVMMNENKSSSGDDSSSCITPSQILDWIQHGSHHDAKVNNNINGRFWTLDPIDGTKGFVRGDQYAVCLALVQDGSVRLGVLGCPALEINGVKGHLLTAVEGQGCMMETLHNDKDEITPPTRVQVSRNSKCMVQSYEASHGNHESQQAAAAALGLTDKVLRMDSQVKYAMVATGRAALYLRLSSYAENIWDHAAGCIIVQEAGGTVTNRYGQALDFASGKKLKPGAGVVVTCGSPLHEKVVEYLHTQQQQQQQ